MCKNFFFFVFLLPVMCYGQSKLEPFASFQFWSVGSTGHEVWSKDSGEYQPVDDRLTFSLRRARFGFRGTPYPTISYQVTVAYDQVGRDVLAASAGNANGLNPSFVLADMVTVIKRKADDERLNLVLGYFRPQVHREDFTSAFLVNSMEKMMTQTYVRRHTTGTGLGRAMGVNMGGIIPGKTLSLHYNTGIFSTTHTAASGSPWAGLSSGRQASPLLAGRATLVIGDLESSAYRVIHVTNAYNRRKGLSLGAGATYQGQTDRFERAVMLTADMLLNYGPLNVDGAATRLIRTSGSGIYASNVFHLRSSYNISLPDNRFLEPVAGILYFSGGMDEASQQLASSLDAFSGRETQVFAGLNWIINQDRFKVVSQVTWQQGQAGAAGDGATVNPFFVQSSVGAIRRGTWAGIGLSLML